MYHIYNKSKENVMKTTYAIKARKALSPHMYDIYEMKKGRIVKWLDTVAGIVYRLVDGKYRQWCMLTNFKMAGDFGYFDTMSIGE
jgi:hypothetical protein